MRKSIIGSSLLASALIAATVCGSAMAENKTATPSTVKIGYFNLALVKATTPAGDAESLKNNAEGQLRRDIETGQKAIEKANAYLQQKSLDLKIEVETRSLDDVKKVMQVDKVHRILLDNFTPQQITDALKIINGKYETEASGGINFENLQEYAATGVDYISSGAIIHQAKSLDLSLKAEIL